MCISPRLLFVVLALNAASLLPGELLVYESFDQPAQVEPPEMWVSDEPHKDHASVAEESLYYPGLAVSKGNRLGLGQGTADYNFDFQGADLAIGETVYFSFLVRIEEVNEFGDISPMLRLYDREEMHGSGVAVGHGSQNYASGVMAFSLNNRSRGYGGKEAVKTQEDLPIGETYFLVASYTRGYDKGDGQVALWVNPRELGADLPPAPTLTMESYQSDSAWNRLVVRANGSGSHPERWSIDEVRIGSTWADVTPIGDTAWIPEPGEYALTIGLGLAAVVLFLRRRRG